MYRQPITAAASRWVMDHGEAEGRASQQSARKSLVGFSFFQRASVLAFAPSSNLLPAVDCGGDCGGAKCAESGKRHAGVGFFQDNFIIPANSRGINHARNRPDTCIVLHPHLVSCLP